MLTAEQILVYAEPFLDLLVLIVFLKAGLARRLPATRNYLAFRVGQACILEVILQIWRVIAISQTALCYLYFYAYWTLYLTGAVLIFLVIREIYSVLMEPVPHLRRLGMMAFHWVIVISCIIAAVIAISAGVTPSHNFAGRLMFTAKFCLHSVCVLELCLLAFIALTIHSLGRSFRSPLFGVSLGFGIQAATSFAIGAVVQWQHAQIWSLPNLLLEISIVVVLLTWTTYFLLPERVEERQAQVVPSPSPLIRWNDVAQALGHTSPHVAAGGSTGFFLQDVEHVVDRVLARNHMQPEVKAGSKVG